MKKFLLSFLIILMLCFAPASAYAGAIHNAFNASLASIEAIAGAGLVRVGLMPSTGEQMVIAGRTALEYLEDESPSWYTGFVSRYTAWLTAGTTDFNFTKQDLTEFQKFIKHGTGGSAGHNPSAAIRIPDASQSTLESWTTYHYFNGTNNVGVADLRSTGVVVKDYTSNTIDVESNIYFFDSNIADNLFVIHLEGYDTADNSFHFTYGSNNSSVYAVYGENLATFKPEGAGPYDPTYSVFYKSLGMSSTSSVGTAYTSGSSLMRKAVRFYTTGTSIAQDVLENILGLVYPFDSLIGVIDSNSKLFWCPYSSTGNCFITYGLGNISSGFDSPTPVEPSYSNVYVNNTYYNDYSTEENNPVDISNFYDYSDNSQTIKNNIDNSVTNIQSNNIDDSGILSDIVTQVKALLTKFIDWYGMLFEHFFPEDIANLLEGALGICIVIFLFRML